MICNILFLISSLQDLTAPIKLDEEVQISYSYFSVTYSSFFALHLILSASVLKMHLLHGQLVLKH